MIVGCIAMFVGFGVRLYEVLFGHFWCLLCLHLILACLCACWLLVYFYVGCWCFRLFLGLLFPDFGLLLNWFRWMGCVVVLLCCARTTNCDNG